MVFNRRRVGNILHFAHPTFCSIYRVLVRYASLTHPTNNFSGRVMVFNRSGRVGNILHFAHRILWFVT
jgi:hypothetical protein